MKGLLAGARLLANNDVQPKLSERSCASRTKDAAVSLVDEASRRMVLVSPRKRDAALAESAQVDAGEGQEVSEAVFKLGCRPAVMLLL